MLKFVREIRANKSNRFVLNVEKHELTDRETLSYYMLPCLDECSSDLCAALVEDSIYLIGYLKSALRIWIFTICPKNRNISCTNYYYFPVFNHQPDDKLNVYVYNEEDCYTLYIHETRDGGHIKAYNLSNKTVVTTKLMRNSRVTYAQDDYGSLPIYCAGGFVWCGNDRTDYKIAKISNNNIFSPFILFDDIRLVYSVESIPRPPLQPLRFHNDFQKLEEERRSRSIGPITYKYMIAPGVRAPEKFGLNLLCYSGHDQIMPESYIAVVTSNAVYIYNNINEGTKPQFEYVFKDTICDVVMNGALLLLFNGGGLCKIDINHK